MRAIALIHDFTNSFFFWCERVLFFGLIHSGMWNTQCNTRVKWTKRTLEFDENVIWKWKTWWDEIYVWISVNNGQQQLNHTKHLLYYPKYRFFRPLSLSLISFTRIYLFKTHFKYSLKRQRIGEKKSDLIIKRCEQESYVLFKWPRNNSL